LIKANELLEMKFHGKLSINSPFLLKGDNLCLDNLKFTDGDSYIHLVTGRKNISFRIAIETDTNFTIFSSNTGVINVQKNSTESVSLTDYLRTESLDIGLTVYLDSRIQVSRNVFGTIPIYYHYLPGKAFIFSSSLADLVKQEIVQLSLDIDETYLKKYCAIGENALEKYNSSTFFKNIKNVLPGHILHVHEKSISHEPYLIFNPDRFTPLKTKSEYCQEVRHLLKKSVGSSLSAKPLGAHLSGGLDSSSIAALVRSNEPLQAIHTFYSTAETRNDFKIDYASKVAHKISSIHHEIPAGLDSLSTLYQGIEYSGFPIHSTSSLKKTHSILEHAKALGVRTMLTGHDGDQIMGNGYGVLKELFKSLRWDLLDMELAKRIHDPSNNKLAKNFAKKSTQQKLKLIKSYYLFHRFSDLLREKGFTKSLKQIINATIYFDLSTQYITRKLISNWLRKFKKLDQHKVIIKKSTAGNLTNDYVPVNFINESVNVDPSYMDYIYSLFSKDVINSSEEHFALSNQYGINIELPFLNKDLLELCAVIPEEFKYYIGSGRGHLREAMKDLLPKEVVEREDKAYFGAYARESAKRLAQQFHDIIDKKNPVWEYINYEEYLKIENCLLKGQTNSAYYSTAPFYALKIISLHIWFSWLNGISKFPKNRNTDYL